MISNVGEEIERITLNFLKNSQKEVHTNWNLFLMFISNAGFEPIPSSDIQVGDLIHVRKNERIPADMILLRTSEKTGASFIRTDQLDGETDWKLRKAVTFTQKLDDDRDLLGLRGTLFGPSGFINMSDAYSTIASAPIKDIYKFEGNFTLNKKSGDDEIEPLNLENTLWMNTVLATGNCIGLVIYTGADTRSVINTSSPQTKVGLLDLELNRLAKVTPTKYAVL